MDLMQYYYFYEVVRAGSIRQAAAKLFVSPSALSRHIKRIEQIHDSVLFVRSAQGMELTEIGKLVYKYTENTLNNRRMLMNEISDLNNLAAGEITYCSIEGVLSSILLPAISDFHHLYPNIQFNGNVLSSAGVYTKVASGLADFGVTFKEDGYEEQIQTLSLFYTRLVGVVSPIHPLAKKKSIRLEQLNHYKLAMLNSEFHTRKVFDVTTKEHAIDTTINFEINQIEILKSFVKKYPYLTILPSFSVENEIKSKHLKQLQIENISDKKIKTVVIKKKNHYENKRLLSFIEHLQSHVPKVP